MMKLTEKERRILGFIETDCRLSVSQIASQLGYKDHSVRHVISKFTANGILKPRVYINPYVLGYSVYTLWLAFNKMTPEDSSHLTKQLVDHPQIATVIEIGGEYSYQLEVLTSEVLDLTQFFEWLANEAGDNLVKKQLAVQTAQHLFGLKVGHGLVEPASRDVSYFLPRRIFVCDEVDHLILAALMKEHIPSRVAKHLDLPVTTIDYRLKRMEKAGVIAGFIYEITGPDFGLSSYILQVFTSGLDKKLTEELCDFALRHPYITYMSNTLGSWDYTIGISVPTQRQSREVEEEISAKFGDRIAKISTHPRFVTLKINDYPFTASEVKGDTFDISQSISDHRQIAE